MLHYAFTWLCGGMAFRAAMRSYGMLRPENFMNRPPFLINNHIVPVLITIAIPGLLVASALLGWHHSGIFGIVLNPFQVFLASILLDKVITRGLSRRLQYSFPLNPIVHLYVVPWIFIVGVVIITVM